MLNIKKIIGSGILTLILGWLLLMPLTSCAALTQVNIQSSASTATDGNWTYFYAFNVPVGETTRCSISSSENNCLGRYLQAWYGFAVGIAGIFATVVIMYGGFKYLASRGDQGQAAKGKEYIIGATTGLALVFLSYTIISLVNPSLTVISMPSLPSFQSTSGVDLSSQSNASETEDTKVTSISQASVATSGTYSKLTGNTEFVKKATDALNTLKTQGKLPDGFTVTSGYRANSSGQHGAGNAFDCTWPGITQTSAQTFVDNLTAVNPSLSTIIESNGEYGSTWTATGMGVHVDGRTNVQHLP